MSEERKQPSAAFYGCALLAGLVFLLVTLKILILLAIVLGIKLPWK